MPLPPPATRVEHLRVGLLFVLSCGSGAEHTPNSSTCLSANNTTNAGCVGRDQARSSGYHQSMIPWPQSISLQLPFITSASLATMAGLDFFFPPKVQPCQHTQLQSTTLLLFFFLIKIAGGCTRQSSAGGFPDTGVNCSSLGIIAPSKSEELCPSNTVYCYFYVCKSLNIKLNELHAPSSWTPAKQEHNAAAVAIKRWWQQSTPLIPHAQQFVMHESWIIMPLLPSNEAQLPETRVYN